MCPFWATGEGEVDLAFALQLLLENGLAETVATPVYAWDRQRVIGERFRITTMGKSYLMRQIAENRAHPVSRGTRVSHGQRPWV